jgi:uncharacterized protein YecE (DUF72 family)
LESFLEGAPAERHGEKIRFGCLSWTYPDWLGSFYPPRTKPTEFLHLYSKIFDLVEIDSSFYRTPSPSTVKQWKEKTPREFLFTAKLPGKITHELRLVGIEHELERFEKTMGELDDKLACVIAQLPPFSKFESDFQKLEAFLGTTNPKIRYAVEFRNKSWLRDETYELLSKHKVSFVWSVADRMGELPPRVTSDFIYLRFMGKFGEFKKFNKVQKDRSEVLEKWWKHLSEKGDSVNLALVLVSNHFSGFAPATVNVLRKLAGKEEADWAILSSSD